MKNSFLACAVEQSLQEEVISSREELRDEELLRLASMIDRGTEHMMTASRHEMDWKQRQEKTEWLNESMCKCVVNEFVCVCVCVCVCAEWIM